MTIAFNDKLFKPGRASSWLIAEFATEERRIDLIQRYNAAAGFPGPAVAQVQDDFIGNRMEPDETVAFITVCMSLITAATRRNRVPN